MTRTRAIPQPRKWIDGHVLVAAGGRVAHSDVNAAQARSRARVDAFLAGSVAEGVEDQLTRQTLANAGCDTVQG